MWASADVDIVRRVDPSAIGPFENADAQNGILLNHHYVDMRGATIVEAREVVEEETRLLQDIEATGNDEDLLRELMDGLYESGSELGGFDVGTAGAIYALSAAGAAPISSCNGGLLGIDSHASEVPHILFSVSKERLKPILASAEIVNAGLINNSGHVEVFANRIPTLNAFAAQLLIELAR